MPLSGRCYRDSEAAERLLSVRERLEATASGLEELELLRQRQEELVRSALEEQEQEEEEEVDEEEEEEERRREKVLQENILLLRKQLNCLRRRDAGLISQLQELDRQISDLRLDTEVSHDPPETDSRPSSGFYELSDGASGSLSNSSNSVFSECFCSMVDGDGRLPSADELAGCLDCDGLVGGLCDDSSSSATVRRSLSAPHPPLLDSSSDAQLKFHCDLVARNGSDVYRYPSPLHAVAVQSPAFLQALGHGGHSREEGFLKGVNDGVDGLGPEPALLSAPVVPQSSSWPPPSSSSSSLTLSHKRLDSYIFSLLQRRALPVRTSRPRTSISTDPSKSVLRQASLCARQGPGLGTLRVSEVKPCWPSGAEGPASSAQRSVENKPENHETQRGLPDGGVGSQSQSSSPSRNGVQNDVNTSSNSLLKKKNTRPPPPSVSTATSAKDLREVGGLRASSSPKDTKLDQELLLRSPAAIKSAKNSPKPLQMEKTERSSLASSSQSPEDAAAAPGHTVNAKYVPTQRQNVKQRKGGGRNLKMVRVKTSRSSEHLEASSERRAEKTHHRSGCKKSRLLDDGGSVNVKVSRRAGGGGATGVVFSSRVRRLPASIPEGRVLDKQTSTLSSTRTNRHHRHGNHHSGDHHHHHHGRDQVVVVAKPKYKRNDYRRLRAIMEVPYDEAFRRAQRRQRKELLGDVFVTADQPISSPYAYTAGSDSEYSAECASLFHSTIVDTSEDERSNYTANRFGDSESSEDEYVEESDATSDTEESGGGGAGGRGRSQLGSAGCRAMRQEMTSAQAKAFVKIKASHNLKRKILRFRTGSLKLMTTV